MFKTISIIVICTIVAFGLVVQSHNDEDEQNNQHQKIHVKTARVIQKKLSIPVHTSGILKATTESKLSFKIPGIINGILVNEGENVKKGQLLAELDLIEIKSKVIQARSAFDKAKRDFERINNLFQDSVATYEQKQNAETGLEIAGAALKAAEFNLKHSKIRAPANGNILQQFSEEHELIGAGMPLFLFGSEDGTWMIEIGVPDREIVNLQIGDSAKVIFDAYPDIKFSACVSEIGGSANPMTGTFEVQLEVEKNRERLFSGFVADVTIYPMNSREYSLIPAESLFEATGNEGTVFQVIYPENRVKKINIKIDNIFNGQLLVVERLENVNEVITDGAPYLRDGSEVIIVQ